MSRKKWAILIVIVVVMIIINIPHEIKYNLKIRLTESKENRTINERVLEEYIDKSFGILKDTFNIKYKGAYSKQTVRSMHGWYYRSWIRAYNITTPIMKNTFEIWIDNRTHEIFGDNFYDVLSTDSKFQHLYSDYIKEKIGIDDENVEFGFYGDKNDIKIDYGNIKNLSKGYDNIFKNIYNYYCTDIKIKNIDDLTYENSEKYAKKYKNMYLEKAIEKTGRPDFIFSGYIDLYSKDYDNSSQVYHFRFDIHNDTKFRRIEY